MIVMNRRYLPSKQGAPHGGSVQKVIDTLEENHEGKPCKLLDEELVHDLPRLLQCILEEEEVREKIFFFLLIVRQCSAVLHRGQIIFMT